MFTPSRYIRNCFLMITLATLAGCIEEGSLLGPDAPASFAHGPGGNGGSRPAPVVENFDTWDMTAWVATDHPLGRGEFESGNVSHKADGGEDGSGALILTLPAGDRFLNGAEIKSAHRVVFRDVEIRLQTPDAPGSISTLFLYQLVRTRKDRNDEIDIEILNGTNPPKILFTTFVRGNPNPTNEFDGTLPFDPSSGFHDYRIEWSPGRVRFLVKNINVEAWTLMKEFTTGVPRHAMHIMSSTWWPDWLPRECQNDPVCVPKLLQQDEFHIIDRIIY